MSQNTVKIVPHKPCTCEEYKFPHRHFGGECRGHSIEFCPRPVFIADPYSTGDHWYRWVEHGCKLKPGARVAA